MEYQPIFLVAPFPGRLMIMVATPGCLRHVLESRGHTARDGVKQQEALSVLVGGKVGLWFPGELGQSVDICRGQNKGSVGGIMSAAVPAHQAREIVVVAGSIGRYGKGSAQRGNDGRRVSYILAPLSIVTCRQEEKAKQGHLLKNLLTGQQALFFLELRQKLQVEALVDDGEGALGGSQGDEEEAGHGQCPSGWGAILIEVSFAKGVCG